MPRRTLIKTVTQGRLDSLIPEGSTTLTGLPSNGLVVAEDGHAGSIPLIDLKYASQLSDIEVGSLFVDDNLVSFWSPVFAFPVATLPLLTDSLALNQPYSGYLVLFVMQLTRALHRLSGLLIDSKPLDLTRSTAAKSPAAKIDNAQWLIKPEANEAVTQSLKAKIVTILLTRTNFFAELLPHAVTPALMDQNMDSIDFNTAMLHLVQSLLPTEISNRCNCTDCTNNTSSLSGHVANARNSGGSHSRETGNIQPAPLEEQSTVTIVEEPSNDGETGIDPGTNEISQHKKSPTIPRHLDVSDTTNGNEQSSANIIKPAEDGLGLENDYDDDVIVSNADVTLDTGTFTKRSRDGDTPDTLPSITDFRDLALTDVYPSSEGVNITSDKAAAVSVDTAGSRVPESGKHQRKRRQQLIGHQSRATVSMYGDPYDDCVNSVTSPILSSLGQIHTDITPVTGPGDDDDGNDNNIETEGAEAGSRTPAANSRPWGSLDLPSPPPENPDNNIHCSWHESNRSRQRRKERRRQAGSRGKRAKQLDKHEWMTPSNPCITQLEEMGFSRRHIDQAIAALSLNIEVESDDLLSTEHMESLVTWLIENETLSPFGVRAASMSSESCHSSPSTSPSSSTSVSSEEDDEPTVAAVRRHSPDYFQTFQQPNKRNNRSRNSQEFSASNSEESTGGDQSDTGSDATYDLPDCYATRIGDSDAELEDSDLSDPPCFASSSSPSMVGGAYANEPVERHRTSGLLHGDMDHRKTWYKGPSDFPNTSDYSSYVKQHARIGMRVAGSVHMGTTSQGSMGGIPIIESTETTGSILQVFEERIVVEWNGTNTSMPLYPSEIRLLPQKSDVTDPLSPYWDISSGRRPSGTGRPAPPGLFDAPRSSQSTISSGDRVRVRTDVLTPRYRWGGVTHSSVGVVRAVDTADRHVVVDFQHHRGWIGQLEELVLVPPVHLTVRCAQCYSSPITGPRFDCRACKHFSLCDACFATTQRHRHQFDRISVPGGPPISAGMPGKLTRKKRNSVPYNIVGDNPAAILSLVIASPFSQGTTVGINALFDHCKGTFWESDSDQAWILLRVRPGMLLHDLSIGFEHCFVPQSSMPSKIIVLAGSTYDQLFEVKQIDIGRQRIPQSSEKDKSNNDGATARTVSGTSAPCHSDSQKPLLSYKQSEEPGRTKGQKPSCSDGIEASAGIRGSKTQDDTTTFKNSTTSVRLLSRIRQPYRYVKLVFVSGGRYSRNYLSSQPTTQSGRPSCPQKSLSIDRLSQQPCVRVSWLTVAGKVLLDPLTLPPTQECIDQAFSPDQTVDFDKWIPSEAKSSRSFKTKHTNSTAKDSPAAPVRNNVRINREFAASPAATLAPQIFGWGLNDKDQLGSSFSGSKLKFPTRLKGFEALDAVQFVGGSKSLFAITRDGKVYACGEATKGRLGLGSGVAEVVTRPQIISNLSQRIITQVAVHPAGRHSLALTSTGLVYSWGQGDGGKLGHGDEVTRYTPTLLENLAKAGIRIRFIAAGSSHSAAIVGTAASLQQPASGMQQYSTLNKYSRQSLPDSATVASNASTTGAVSKISQRQQLTIEPAGHLMGQELNDSLSGVQEGSLFTWGLGEFGRLGHGDETSRFLPTLVTAPCLAGKRVVHVACGSRDAQTLCLTQDGTVYSWGDADFGKLGRSTTSNFPAKKKSGKPNGDNNETANAASPTDAGTINSPPTVDIEPSSVDGFNDAASLSGVRRRNSSYSVPASIQSLLDREIIQVECGAQFSVALDRYGTVFTWGKGDYFRLGHGNDQHCREPRPIDALRGIHVVKVAVGALHCIALTNSGELYAWGDNDHGQQGIGTTTPTPIPSRVEHVSSLRITDVACGSSHCIAISDPLKEADSVLRRSWASSSSGSVIDRDSVPSRFIVTPVSSSLGVAFPDALPSRLAWLQNAYGANSAHSSLPARVDRGPVEFQSASDPLGAEAMFPASQSEEDQSGESPRPTNDRHQPSSRRVSFHETPHQLSTCRNFVSRYPLSRLVAWMDSPSVQRECLTIFFRQTIISYSRSVVCALLAAGCRNMSTLAQHRITTDVHALAASNRLPLMLTSINPDVLFEFFKLVVAGRILPETQKLLRDVLNAWCKSDERAISFLIKNCIEDLSGLARFDVTLFTHRLQPVIQESSHPYTNDSSLSGRVKIQGAHKLKMSFDPRCSTEHLHDPLVIMDGAGDVVATRSGSSSVWASDVIVSGDEIRWKFTSDNCVRGWGFRFVVHPVLPQSGLLGVLNQMSDRHILGWPSFDLIKMILNPAWDANLRLPTIASLSAALLQCIEMDFIGRPNQVWALKRLSELVRTGLRMSTDKEIGAVDSYAKVCSQFSSSSSVKAKNNLRWLNRLKDVLPAILKRQYAYEEAPVRTGRQLSHSDFLKILCALCCDIGIDKLVDAPWFVNYCIAKRTMDALISRTSFPHEFTVQVLKRLNDMLSHQHYTGAAGEYDTEEFSDEQHIHSLESQTSSQGFLANGSLSPSADFELVEWVGARPQDWAHIGDGVGFTGSAGTIYGWGHNHRGQLGGEEGSKVRLPLPCDNLTGLRPVQLVGGEQTLFAVTAKGRVYATGYGAGGRLGKGGLDSAATPVLLDGGGLSKAFVTQIAVCSGGKHTLALTKDGRVFSWGEGEDGKLGHDSRNSCDRPRLIEALNDIKIIDVAAGGAHSACISEDGLLYTWGRGRFGRLGHGDSEDQLKPKLVEALVSERVTHVTCGSGDAQTLCLTHSRLDEFCPEEDAGPPQTTVWSWGDGDYGKLGRGGSDASKVPLSIDNFNGVRVKRVLCGSQFSLALTADGAVYTWGKGDYHRLGHGCDEHIRRPKRVVGLQGKVVVDAACGSLHCLVVTNKGEVYAWGDNDEGQLGDGTTSAAPRPKLVYTLQDKRINRVAAGSAHSYAWSTHHSDVQLPLSAPAEYHHLSDVPIPLLRNRLITLQYFSELFIGSIQFFDVLSDPATRSAVRRLILPSIKEAAFRKTLQATMVRDRQHGPVIQLNRVQSKRRPASNKSKTSDDTAGKTVFGQMVDKMHVLTPECFRLPHRAWKVKFVGESVDDCGGGYSDSIAEMTDELCEPDRLGILIPAPDYRQHPSSQQPTTSTDQNRQLQMDQVDSLVFNPFTAAETGRSEITPEQRKMLNFVGILFGIAIRNGSPISVRLFQCMWKLLVHIPLTPEDLAEIDRDFVPGLQRICEMSAEEFNSSPQIPASVFSCNGVEVALSSGAGHVGVFDREEFKRKALNSRLHEFDDVINAVHEGMSRVIPLSFLSLFTPIQFEALVCGSPDIPLDLLRSVTVYRGLESDTVLIAWFWEVLTNFGSTERSLFLRFVWGRTRLPRNLTDFRGREFVIHILDIYEEPDKFLPESYTCFFILKLPRYTSRDTLDAKLRYAIHNCRSIDTDEYARVMEEPTSLTIHAPGTSASTTAVARRTQAFLSQISDVSDDFAERLGHDSSPDDDDDDDDFPDLAMLIQSVAV